LGKKPKKAPYVAGLCFLKSIFQNRNLIDLIALANRIDHFQAFDDFSEAGMVSVQMCCIVPAVADEKLRTTSISAGMRHGKHTPVVVLISTGEFTVDFVAWTACAVAFWTTALDDKVRDYPVESQAIVKAFFRQGNKVFDCLWSVFLKKLHFHGAFDCLDFCVLHFYEFSQK
jgi:hypothetical protein